MFDAATAELLRSAPGVPGLDPKAIPRLLTAHYAALVSQRLRGTGEDLAAVTNVWPPERIADTYELIASLSQDHALRRASAFVAGTAQQIIARRHQISADKIVNAHIDRDSVAPSIAAAVLFLSAEQYADANDAASGIRTNYDQLPSRADVLAEHIADLASGRLNRILERAKNLQSKIDAFGIEERALDALLDALSLGVVMLAAQFLRQPSWVAGGYPGPREVFTHVLQLSATAVESEGGRLVRTYAGPHHLASLLLAAYDGMKDAAITNVPPPVGADPEFWQRWLGFRASKFPYVWPNHHEAISKQFHQTGISSVVVLPTGAGKTTVSSLKIAGVLARGKKVVFLAPTHALVDQLTSDLQEMFPKEVIGSVVSSDFDLLFQSDGQLKEIEVMTPERCLAMLSFAADAFVDVGLLVFDECHLLSPIAGKLRRSLDGMLCLLGFVSAAPNADLLFLSAMLKNGAEFARWISNLTERPCVSVDLLWKPSRQARGVVIYRDDDLITAKKSALRLQHDADVKKGKAAAGLRTVAERELRLTPWAIWGLQHNWLEESRAYCTLLPVLSDPVQLAGEKKYGALRVKPNANEVAVRLAVAASKSGLKSIVFVNTKNDAVAVAEKISANISKSIHATESEQELWAALEAEMGGIHHSIIPAPVASVPHNSAMLPLERNLAERLFKRPNGADVIVATPTLAQGLNLPAHLAILAGDRRADGNSQGRQDLGAHEILNAAARAGRAGHLANGVVLLIPEPIISFGDDKPLEGPVLKKLKSILPEDDRCVAISDPLEIVLDRLMGGDLANSDVRYFVNRMAVVGEVGTGGSAFDLGRSFGSFMASMRKEQAQFEAKVSKLQSVVKESASEGVDGSVAILASQSGLSLSVLARLKSRIEADVGTLPASIDGWLSWTCNWLKEDTEARHLLLEDIAKSIHGACGTEKTGDVTIAELDIVLGGIRAWTKGKSVSAIERQLGGDPTSTRVRERTCPRARELILSVIPRSFSFIVGLVSHVTRELDPFELQDGLDRQLVELLQTAVRRGFDSPEKVLFASENPRILSRVQIHSAFAVLE